MGSKKRYGNDSVDLFWEDDPRYQALLRDWQNDYPPRPSPMTLLKRVRWWFAVWSHLGRHPTSADDHYNRMAW